MASRRKQPQQKQPTETTETRWARKLNAEYQTVLAQIRKTVASIISFGQHLSEAKDDITKQGGKWGEFLSKHFDRKFQDNAAKYMAVARNSVLAKSENSRNLPAHLDTLYKLSRLPEPVLQAEIDRPDGDVHPHMTSKDIDKLNLRPQTPLAALAQDIAFAARFTNQRGGTNKRGMIPALTHLYLSKGQVRAFAGSTGIIWSTPGWSLDQTVAVEATDLVRALNDLVEGGWREAKVSVEDDKLIVQAGTSRTALPLLEADLEPAIKAALSMEPPREGMPVSSDFWDALGRVESTVSQDATKPNICGVYWSPQSELMATDNYRITVCKTIPCPMDGGLLIPKYFLNMLGSRRLEFTQLAVVDDDLWLLHERGAVYGRLLEGATFPAEQVRKFVTQARETAETATRITVLADPQRSIERVVERTEDVYHKIHVDAVDGALTVSAPDVEDQVSAEVVGGPASFAVNGKFLLDALLKISRTRTFLYTPGSPLLVRSDDGQVEHLLTLLLAKEQEGDALMTRAETQPEPPSLSPQSLLSSIHNSLIQLGADLERLVANPEVQNPERLARELKQATAILPAEERFYRGSPPPPQTITSMRERWTRLSVLFEQVFSREERP